MSSYTIKTYNTLHSFLQVAELTLWEEEFQNSIFLTMIQGQNKQETETGEKVTPFYYGTIWDDQNQLVFSLSLLKKTMLYGSSVLGSDLTPVDILIQDFILRDLHKEMTTAYAFQPVLDRLYTQLKEKGQLKIDIIDKSWAYDIETTVWSPIAKQIAQDKRAELRIATEQDLPLLTEWTQGFWDAISDTFDISAFPCPEVLCRDSLKDNVIYILDFDGVPVNMAWKRRPLKKGVAIANVYTPKEQRSKGYAAACVAMLTEELLKSYEYVSLFALGSQNPEKNLYTTIGYRWRGASGRLIISP